MKTMLTILPLMISYTAILAVTVIINKLRPGITNYEELKPSNLKTLSFFHAFVVIVMIFPVFTTPSSPYFFLLFPYKIGIGHTIAFLVCFNTINFFPWKRSLNADDKIGNAIIGDHVIFIYTILRVIFLASYEWFFRGLLLFGFSLLFGTIWSIIINLSLYILIHFHKSKREIVGCLPFGILLCVFTVWWQSVWPAVVFHVQIAMIHEWPTLKKFISPSKQATI